MKEPNNLMIVIVSLQIDAASQPMHAFRHPEVFIYRFKMRDSYSLTEMSLLEKACWASFHIIYRERKKKK